MNDLRATPPEVPFLPPQQQPPGARFMEAMEHSQANAPGYRDRDAGGDAPRSPGRLGPGDDREKKRVLLAAYSAPAAERQTGPSLSRQGRPAPGGRPDSQSRTDLPSTLIVPAQGNLNGKPAQGGFLKRLAAAFSMENTPTGSASVSFYGRSFGRPAEDTRDPTHGVDQSIRSLQSAAMRSAGLNLMATLMSSVISGLRRLSQGN